LRYSQLDQQTAAVAGRTMQMHRVVFAGRIVLGTGRII
jgi:hypothetical protein